jgi:hypothetical protein
VKLNPNISLCNKRISPEQGSRQERAADIVLKRLIKQPGVILADEVGMGKTFVAMAVAASVAAERPTAGPVIVMVPSSLKDKWPRDWDVFSDTCLRGPLKGRLVAKSASSGLELLARLDGRRAERPDVIFLTHGALHRSVGDGFAKLAMIKRAFKGRKSLTSKRRVFDRFAGTLLQLDSSVERLAPGILGRLLELPYEKWQSVLHDAAPRFKEWFKDEPVPERLAAALERMPSAEFADMVEVLHSLPQRESNNTYERLKTARQAINRSMRSVWEKALTLAKFKSPLLILDEAHHVKNPGTRLASLFVSEDAAEDSELFGTAGPLGGKFERMLFLTATPFQLGHRELIRVLERFEGVSWKGKHKPANTRTEFLCVLRELTEKLDRAQGAALRLDCIWGRLRADQIVDDAGTLITVDRWWEDSQGQVEGLVAEVRTHVRATQEAIKVAEKELEPWVLRHLKEPTLSGSEGVARRELFTGAAISGGPADEGLGISEDVVLPFLLAGRAQTLIAHTANGRALFAEGLSSSFEAYLETRRSTIEFDEDEEAAPAESSDELEWYLRHLDRALPKHDSGIRASHPKVRATAQRVVDLWSAGQKVLVFCHYRATGRALRLHVSSLMEERTIQIASKKLTGMSRAAVLNRLDALGKAFFRKGRLRTLVTAWLERIVGRVSGLDEKEREQVVEVLRRLVRTPAFLVRYFELERTAIVQMLDSAIAGNPGRVAALENQAVQFCSFLLDRTKSERAEILDALMKVQTGSHYGMQGAVPGVKGAKGSRRAVRLLPNVRLANGETENKVRRILLLTFNTPLFPEVLIASSVLAEGVDLHLFCRHVIHHDLCWNPSTLEQRTGRVDRIGSMAEREKASIEISLPYLAATQDEKMFRVVRDRERWFQIVMGENYQTDEASTDRQAERVPLPVAVQRELTMRLHPE